LKRVSRLRSPYPTSIARITLHARCQVVLQPQQREMTLRVDVPKRLWKVLLVGECYLTCQSEQPGCMPGSMRNHLDHSNGRRDSKKRDLPLPRHCNFYDFLPNAICPPT